MEVFQIIQTLKEIKPLFEKEGFIILGLFGSFSRNEANQNSDIDLLYELKEPFFKQNSGFSGFSKLTEIKTKLKNIFNRDVDICAKNSLSQTGKKYILKELINV
jgi:predicted nucleotidyltransferase